MIWLTIAVTCVAGALLGAALGIGLHLLHRQAVTTLERMGRRRRGFSLIELLVVIAIIGVLLGLLLPAIQFARESARRATCANHLRQLGLGFQLHADCLGHLPTGGWGWSYVGQDSAGYGRLQPGGWPFAILTFIEQDPIRKQPLGLITRPIALFHCPSLRSARPYPITLQPRNVPPSPIGAKVDYGACAGAGLDEWGPGHPNERPVDLGGIVGVKSCTRLAEILDGLSNTILLSEKFLHPLYRDSGTCKADNENLYTGLDNDSCRSTKFPPQTIGGREGFPYTFGSYHPGGFNAALCDGSIRPLSYQISLPVFQALGTRNGMEVNQ